MEINEKESYNCTERVFDRLWVIESINKNFILLMI